jgi:hypothetical protein
MATTILLGLAARAWGFPGRGTRIGVLDGSRMLWRLRLQSQDADTRTPVTMSVLLLSGGQDLSLQVHHVPWDLLYATQRTGAACLLRAVISPDSRLILPQLVSHPSSKFTQRPIPIHDPVHASGEGIILIVAETDV